MNAQQFQSTSIAVLRTAVEWQSRIAELLGTDSRTIAQWMQTGEVPVYASEKLAELMGMNDLAPWPRDEWILGDAIDGLGRKREYLVHTPPPRFIARVVALDDDQDILHSDLPADTESGPVFMVDPNTLLCEIAWIDPVGPEEIVQLMNAAAEAIDAFNEDIIF